MSKTDSSECKTAQGLLNRLNKIIIGNGSNFVFKCGYCNNTICVSDWYNGKTLKTFIEMNKQCEDCRGRFV